MIYSLISIKNKAEKLNTLLSSIKGISKTELTVVSFNEIVSVISKNNENIAIPDKNSVLQYADVIEQLAQHFTLLPMRYGSTMPTVEAIQSMLKINYTEIFQNLLKVQNKSEFGLKIFCDTQQLRAQIQAKAEINTTLPYQLENQSNNSVFKNYVNKKLQEHRLEELMICFVDSLILEITTFLVNCNAFFKFKKMTTSTNIIDAVFLFDKEKQNELVLAVETLQKNYPHLNFVLTGPWSPYNFVEITIK